MNLHLTIAVVAGAAVGLGVFLVVRELVPATPHWARRCAGCTRRPEPPDPPRSTVDWTG